jgi:O-acetyl-ADP-ribose deacetylase (regulator of RNase III)
MPRKAEVKSLYYITHVDNVPSILEHGILSHGQMESQRIPFKPIYDANIVSNRKGRFTPDGRSLWEYANVYFQPRNPMMYRVIHEKGCKELAVVGVAPVVMNGNGVFVTDGNAASNATHFFPAAEGLRILQDNWQTIQLQYWNDRDGSKRKIMAECLTRERIAPEHIHTIFVADHETREKVEKRIRGWRVSVVPDSDMFFQPRSKTKIGNISLIDGDMFFSGMQTLTVSVNLQGIMGKGLASRAKYQFPDVYVVYQDACRSRRITATKPFLYKREASLDEELADQAATSPIETPNAVKWFLLFATKRKWREDSRIEDIEGGLHWFREHFETEGIQSVALPALGCGLGGLNWADVGPLMFRYLHDIGIDVAIYLPRERITDRAHLSEAYLLGAPT